MGKQQPDDKRQARPGRKAKKSEIRTEFELLRIRAAILGMRIVHAILCGFLFLIYVAAGVFIASQVANCNEYLPAQHQLDRTAVKCLQIALTAAWLLIGIAMVGVDAIETITNITGRKKPD